MGYSATSGPGLRRPELCTEALRLARLLHRRLPSSAETTGLLALLLLADSRRATREIGDGVLVLLAEQNRTCWDTRPGMPTGSHSHAVRATNAAARCSGG